ncbi:acyl-CoA thioesterase, partial [Pseudomonas aeruginosa]|uniref:acyl-CoA thioesterase n=1 Tax=Pseudomonas aeruginosa TaxID=287 RepID=UPI003CC65A4B
MSSAAQRQNYTFIHSLRVRWAEVDPQGIVFNGNYQTYLDVPTIEYYRQLGLSNPADLL